FVAQVLRHTGNLDHFLVQPAAVDHHGGMHGLLECSISAAELAICAHHRPGSFEPLPPRVDELVQVCSAAAFLFDIGKVFDPQPNDDRMRRVRPVLTPYKDLARCWRSSWKALYGRSPALGVMAILAVVYTLHWASAVFIPLLLGVMFSYALSPAVDRLERWRVPRPLSAALLILAVLAALGTTAYRLSDDTGALIET